jgi:hypothetical protein
MGDFKVFIGEWSIVNTLPTGTISLDKVTLKNTTTRPLDTRLERRVNLPHQDKYVPLDT